MDWEYSKIIDNTEINYIAKKYNISHLAAEIILKRDIDSLDDFLCWGLDKLKDPFDFEDMKEAASFVVKKIKSNEKMFIYGDYDVDGITSAAYLTLALRNIGADVEYYIPNRLDEGYGLNNQAIDYIKNKGSNLVITVDVGVNSANEIKYAKDVGLDVIITDHHKMLEEPEVNTLVINPKLSEKYDFNYLSGSGVAFKFAQAIYTEYGKDLSFLYDYLDIVMLGTVADVVPLINENRIIVKNGLNQINNTNIKGLKYLFKYLNLVEKEITTTDVSFFISPLLNALGRINDSKIGVDLFLEEDDFTIYNIIEEMKSANRKRRNLEREIFDDVIKNINDNINNVKYIVMHNENWHPGVIGVVAAKLSLKYNIPVVLISLQNGIGKASCRSVEGLNIFEVLSRHKECLIRFGGHDLAAGFIVRKENLNTIEEELKNEIKVKRKTPKKKLKVDVEIELDRINDKTLCDLKVISPYGLQNSQPLFLTKGVYFERIKRFGIEDQHFNLKIRKNSEMFEAVCFNLSNKLKTVLSSAQKFDVVYYPDRVFYKGNEFIQLKIKDFKLSDNCEFDFN